MGSDEIALPLLEWLVTAGAEQGELIAIYTQPDRATGRGQKVVPNAIKRWAQDREIPVLQPSKLTKDVRLQFDALSADLAIVMAYGHILGEKFLNTPRLGTVNLHASILPQYRGASPIQAAVCSGDAETGVTLMRIVRELDAGPVADIERVSIAPTDTALDIESKLAAASAPLIARNLESLLAGSLKFEDQDSSRVSFCRKLTKLDGVLDFQQPARVLAARINGLHPWPGARVTVGDHIIRLGGAAAEAEMEPSGSSAPGSVVVADASGLKIATGEGLLSLTRLQRPGGKMMPAADFLRGFELSVGDILPSSEMPNLVSFS